MQILECHLKNFGKFHDHHVYFDDQLEVISGENEYGKSTIYAFIKAMLFGMERGRGRAAKQDEFSKYEPWDNPNYYAGMMRFQCGDRIFRLERNFDRYRKSASLICENDGEELSIEDGDLEMLLGGMTVATFENVAAIGQLTAKPGQELASKLQNYAANYYETGSSSIDLNHAFDVLKFRKKQVEQARKGKQAERTSKWNSLEKRKSYVQNDLAQLQQNLDEVDRRKEKLQKEYARYKKETGQKGTSQKEFAQKGSGQRQSARNQVSVRGKGFRMSGMILMGIAIIFVIVSRFLHMEVAGVLLGAVSFLAGVVLCMISVVQSKRIKRHEPEHFQREDDIDQKDDIKQKDIIEQKEIHFEDQFKKLSWERNHMQQEKQEKELEISNIREQMEELEDETDEELAFRRRLKALELAEQKLRSAAEEMASSSGDQLNQRASAILYEVTDGKYSRLVVDENLELAVLCDGKRIEAQQLSRGTLEQVYFAIRMAALNLLDEEEFPVIFDDAFVCYDEKRLNSALKWLSEQPRQVIIFSCQTREKRWKDEVQ